MTRTISRAGLDLLKRFEGCELKAYPDPASDLGRACTAAGYSLRSYFKLKGWKDLSGKPWTIGYGETGPEVVEGLKITAEDAETLLARRLETEFEPGVRAAIGGNACTQGQFDALVCLAYNIGVRALTGSTLIKLFRAGKGREAAQQFDLWTKAGGKVMAGLVKRRAAEKELFNAKAN